MKNIPNKIYLQIGTDENDLDFNDLVEVSWCVDKINNSDIEFNLNNNKYISFCCNSEMIKRDDEDYLICSYCSNAIMKIK